jgi:hypothetical protein
MMFMLLYTCCQEKLFEPRESRIALAHSQALVMFPAIQVTIREGALATICA